MKKFFNKSLLLVLCACLLDIVLTAVLFCSVFYTRTVNLAFEITPPRCKIEILYRDNNTSVWKKQIADAGKNSYKITLPVRRLQAVCFKFHIDKNDTITLKNIKLQGRNNKNIYNLAVTNTDDCIVDRTNPAELHIKALRRNPQIMLQSDAPIKGTVYIDPVWAGVVFSLIFMLSFALLKFTTHLIVFDKTNILELIFVTVFAVIILIPGAKINFADKSEIENRKLACLPDFFNSDKGTVNSHFGLEFDKYFSDRFCGRTYIINQYKLLKTVINSRTSFFHNNYIIEGKDKWYFIRIKNKRNIPGICQFSAEDMKIHLETLKQFNEWCKKHDIKFYYFIAPDKRQVYDDKYVYKSYDDAPTDISPWVDYIRSKSDINVIYPLNVLKKKKSEDVIYYPKDTHWNYLGAYYGYAELMNFIKKDFADIVVFKPEKYTEETGGLDDLKHFAPEIKIKDNSIYKQPLLPDNKKLKSRLEKAYNEKNKNGKYNALILRDSFSAALLDYCFSTFRNTRAYWRYSLTAQDIRDIEKNKNKPDIIILEHVERFAADALRILSENVIFLD